MQISRGGTWAIGIAAAALFAVLVSYAPQELQMKTAAAVAAGYYAVDEWGYADEYGYQDYGYDNYGNRYGTTYSSGYAPNGSYYEEYVEYYEPTPRAAAAPLGWGVGGTMSPFPALSTPIVSGFYPQAQPIVVSNQNYLNYYNTLIQQQNVTNAYNTRVAWSNYLASQPKLPKPSCGLRAQPTTVQTGGSVNLTWGSQYATSAYLDAVGSVEVNGSRTVSGLTNSRTFGVTVYGPGGNDACYATVTVRDASPLTCLISTNPVTIQRGQSAQLAWGSTGASNAKLTGPGGTAAVPTSGGITITPSVSTSYTIAVRDSFGNTQSCTTGILVQ
jgi:hypothetical protein